MSIISEVTNPFITTRQQIKNKNGDWVNIPFKEVVQKQAGHFNRSISEDGTSILTSFGKATTIEMFEFTNHKDDPTIYPLLYIDPRHDENYNSIIHTISKTGRTNPTPNILRLHHHEFLGVEYDSEGENAKVYLKKPIHLPQGCRLVLKGFNDSKSTYKIFWTEEVTEND